MHIFVDEFIKYRRKNRNSNYCASKVITSLTVNIRLLNTVFYCTYYVLYKVK